MLTVAAGPFANGSFANSGWLPLFWLLVAAVVEECVFRAGIQEALLRFMPCASKRLFPVFLSSTEGPVPITPQWLQLSVANGLTAVLFALAHGLNRAWWLAGAALPASLLLGWIYERERRVWPCIAAHAVMNLCWYLLAAILPSLPQS